MKKLRKLRIGIVGLGRVASKTHIPVLKSLENVELICGAETNAERAKRVQNLFAFNRVYDDYAEMFESESLDGVYICLPNFLHKDACIKALENGIHVLCEKPMGTTVEEAEEITRLAEDKGLVLMPGYKKRYANNFSKAKKMIDDGILGKIIQVQGVFLTPGPYISWDPKSDWYLDERWHGAIYDSGCHLIDVLLYLLPFTFTEVHAFLQKAFTGYNTPTNISCFFKMDGGIVGDLAIGWRGATDVLALSIYGTAGNLTVSREYIEYLNPGTDPIDRIKIHLGNAFSECAGLLKKVTDKVKGRNFYREDLIQARNFRDAILGLKKPSVSGEDAEKIHRFMELMIH
jgi:predicted dehydrogenase